MRRSLLALLLLPACVPPASAPKLPPGWEEDGGAGGRAAPPLEHHGSFDATFQFTYGEEPPPAPEEWPRGLRLKVAYAQLEPGRAQLLVGSSQGRELGRDDGAAWEPPLITSGTSLAISLQADDCQPVGLVIDGLAFEVRDTDGDGAGDELTGHATGSLWQTSGDMVFALAFEAVVTGEADLEAPALDESTTSGLSPLDPLELRFPEPVRLGPAAQLLVDGVEVRARVSPVGEPTYAARVIPAAPLPWGAVVELGGVDAVDLLGNAAPPLESKSQVDAAPAGFPQPSFEGAGFVGYAVEGDVRGYDGSSGLAPDHGNAFAVADNREPWRIVYELEVPSSPRTILALTARALSAWPGVVRPTRLRLLARAGEDQVEGFLELPPEGRELPATTIQTLEGPVAWAGEQGRGIIELAPLAGRRAIVALEPEGLSSCGGGEGAPVGAVMLDSLGLE